MSRGRGYTPTDVRCPPPLAVAARLLPALLLALVLGRAGAADERPRGEHRDLVADRVEHDFGFAAQNDDLETTFTLTNRSNATIRGLAALGECGCNEVELGATELAPGASTELQVGFHTLWLSGHLMKTIRVRTDDDAAGELFLRQRIAIVKDLVLAPHSVTYTDVRRGMKPTKTFRVCWYEGQGQPFRVTHVEVPGHPFVAEVRPLEDPEDAAWKGWEVALTFGAPAQEGMLSAEAVVLTDHPDHPRLVLPVSANVSGPVWVQARTLHFGVRPQGEERITTIRFRPVDETVVFGEVRARAREGKVLVETGPDPVHFDRGGYWFLKVTLPADTPPGPVEGEVVELDVGLAGEPVIELPVRAVVKARAPTTEGEGSGDGG